MYKIFENLLISNNVTAYKVSKDTGIPYSALSEWKSGRSTPKQDKLLKLAEYFGVTVDYLMGVERDENVQYYLNDETKQIAQEIFENKELRMLFDASRKAKPEDLKAVHELLLHMKRRENHEE